MKGFSLNAVSNVTLFLALISSVQSFNGLLTRTPSLSSCRRSFSSTAFDLLNERNDQKSKAVFENTFTISTSSTCLNMYNLPPENNNNRNPISDILPGIVTLFGLTAFFMSPLGGIFFAITNSLLLISFLTPVLLFVGFQIWKAVNTIDGACPSCGSPTFVMKDDQPSVCFNCGAILRSTQDKKGIELCNVAPSFEDDKSDLFRGNGSIFDLFGQPNSYLGDESAISTEEKSKKKKRETTVIDVEVSDD